MLRSPRHGRLSIGSPIALLGVILSSSLYWAPPAQAGRAVLNQTSATIEKIFGPYWTKLTTTNATGQAVVIYTYSPAPVQDLFPDRPATILQMSYVGDRVQSVEVLPYRTPQEVTHQTTELDDSTIQKQQLEARFFEAIFGYRPPIYKPLYLNYGSFYSYINCLGDGVASAYSVHFSTELMGGIALSYNTACEPPYDKIKFTEEKGPSGG